MSEKIDRIPTLIPSIDSPDQSIFAWVDSPTNGFHSTTLLCPPWGYEHNCAYQTLRVLANMLAQHGHRVVRLDPVAAGNSGLDEAASNGLSHSSESIVRVVEWARQTSPGKVGIVGIRSSAVSVASHLDVVDFAVLWDPTRSGKNFARTLRAKSKLWGFGNPSAADGPGIVVAGHYLPNHAIESIQDADVVSFVSQSTTPVLVLSNESWITELAEQPQIQTDHANGTSGLLDVIAEESSTPVELLDRIVEFVSAQVDLSSPPSKSSEWTYTPVSTSTDNYRETHRIVGQNELHVVDVQPIAGQFRGTVVFLNNGVARSIGPGRAWVEWSRRLASIGVASRRVDISGIGESGTRPGQMRSVHYPIEGIEDVREVVDDLLKIHNGPIILAGVCSGAYLAIDAAAAVDAVTAALSINPALHHVPDRTPQKLTRRANRPTHRLLARNLYTRVGYKLTPMTPSPVWLMLDLLHLHPLPDRGLLRLAKTKRVAVVYWNQDDAVDRLDQQVPRWRKNWARQSKLSVLLVDDADHSMFNRSYREVVYTHLVELCDEVFDGANGSSSPDSNPSATGDSSEVSH